MSLNGANSIRKNALQCYRVGYSDVFVCGLLGYVTRWQCFGKTSVELFPRVSSSWLSFLVEMWLLKGDMTKL